MANPNITRSVDLDSDKITPYFNAFSFNIAGASTQTFEWQCPFELLVTGAEAVITGETAGDYIKVEIVDVDNILGQGANTVLETPVPKYYIDPTAGKEKVSLGYPNYTIAGLYWKFSYTGTNVLGNVVFRVNIIAHKVKG